MRREAARRAREMQKRVYFGKQQEPSPYADYPPEEPPQKKTPPPQTGMPLLGNLAQFRPTGLLSGLDGDTMLILAMMVMLYKDGGWDGKKDRRQKDSEKSCGSGRITPFRQHTDKGH